MLETIPLVDLKSQFVSIKDEIVESMEHVISSCGFVLGDDVKEFEKRFADYTDTKHCIGVASGTDALHLALKALGIGPGDEVITVANTFVATVLAVVYVGATPVLVDASPKDFNLDFDQVEQKITDKTKAILPVHL